MKPEINKHLIEHEILKTASKKYVDDEITLNSEQLYEVSTEGLVLGMNFNSESISGAAGSETVLDSSIYNNHGTNSGATHSATGGFNGGGYFSFDGSNDRIDSTLTNDLANDDSTVAIWIKFDNTDANQGIWEQGDGNSNRYLLWVDETSPSIDDLRVYADGNTSISINVPDETNWHHVVVTHSGTTLNLYMDGELADTSEFTQFTRSSDNFNFGTRPTGTDYFKGYLDETKVYNRALSADEVKNLYKQREEIHDPFVSQKNTDFISLTDNSMADTLHRHSELSASDGTPDPALSVIANGNVGIGTTAPGAKLDIIGNQTIRTTGANPTSEFIEFDNEDRSPESTYAGSNRVLFNTNTRSGNTRDGSIMYFGGISAPSNAISYLLFSANTTLTRPTDATMPTGSHMVIDSNGKVGIGTTNPSSPLNVYVDNSDTTAPMVRLEQDGTGDTSVYYMLTGSHDFSTGIDNTDNNFKFAEGADLGTNTRMTIQTSTGNVGIGTASPNYKLEVQGTASTSQLYLGNGIGTPAGTFLAVDANGLVIATTTPTASVDEAAAYTWTGAHSWDTEAIFTGGLRTNSMYATSTLMDYSTTTKKMVIGTTQPTTDALFFLGGDGYITGGLTVAGGLISGSASTTNNMNVGAELTVVGTASSTFAGNTETTGNASSTDMFISNLLHLPGGMCIGEDTGTTTPNVTIQACSEF